MTGIPTPAEVAEALANVFDSRNFPWIVGDVELHGPFFGVPDVHHMAIPMVTDLTPDGREFRVVLTVEVVVA